MANASPGRIDFADFVEGEVQGIVDEWVEFARTGVPEAHWLPTEDLADHAKLLLLAIAADIRCSQTASEAHEKSVGNSPGDAPEVTRIGRDHAEQRFAQGFSLNHILSEFRALRASVIRRWTNQLRSVPVEVLDAIDGLTRFGESMDQALAASVSLYSAKVNDSRNLLLGILGHDLRNPLSVVHMVSEGLLQSETLPREQSEAVARIFRSAGRMKAMVSDLLDFTQTALGVPLPISPQPCDLAKLATSIVSEVSTVHPGRAVELFVEGDLDGSWDADRIEQLLSNLVSNAVQHGARGKPVTVRASGVADAVVLSIRNEGAPIPSEQRKTLFLPLRQTADANGDRITGSSGLGLGLYIAHEIAVAHGGSLEVTSDDVATTFTLSLPRAQFVHPRQG